MHRPFRYAVASCALAVIGAAVAVPAEAASSTVTLTSHVQSVKTSTGKSLKFMVSAVKAGSPTVSVSLSTSGESHTWRFALSSSSFTYNGSTGKAVLKTGSQISPYGTFNLTFAKTSQSSKSCSGGTTKTVKGTLKGIARFVSNTGKSGWGNVGSATKTFTFTTPSFVTVITGEGCTGGGTPTATCVSGITWTGPFANSTFLSGTQTGSTSTISVFRTVKLAKPAKATRSDALTLAGQPAPKQSNGSVLVTTKAGTRWSGSASLSESGGTFPSQDTPCTLNGVSHTQHVTSYYQAPWTSPSSGRLKADFRVTPDYLAPTSSTGQVIVSSYS